MTLTLIRGQGLRCNCDENGSIFQMYQGCPIHGGFSNTYEAWRANEATDTMTPTEALANWITMEARLKLLDRYGQPLYLAVDNDEPVTE
jgi:hypothetical protein